MISLCLTLSGLLVLSSLYILIPLLNVLSQDLQSPLYLTAYTNTGFSLFYAIGFLCVGKLIPQYGSKRILVYGMFGLAITTWITGMATSMQLLILFRAVQGFIAAAFAPAALTYISDHYPPEKRIVVMSCVTTGFITAGIIGQIFSSAVNDYWGWRGVFGLLAFAYLALALLNNFLLVHSSPSEVKQENLFPAFKKFTSHPDLPKAYFAAFTLLLSFVALYSSLDRYLLSKFQLNSQEAFYIRTMGIAGIAGSLFVPKLAQKLSFQQLAALGIALMLSGLLLCVWSGSVAGVQMALIIFIAGLLITIPSIITLIGQLAGEMRNMAVTWYTFILFVGASVGPLIASADDFTLVIGILAFMLSIAFFSVLRIASGKGGGSG
ncbi:MFS transporter|uniref:Predicted arabinose efflux permease, MFS family n=1 Tax=Dendrosporobacter quercicolus TaxID=146817 RepID=A0A1G9NST3_9FIRM|nr:MFS transporter [Dendrosporobacter quercicolus]NSL47437.1 MFS transporter [Dendrosporobacter quercicolus DSM 1736]SDL89401.1 Predicted arabinose efflux permease, MFS family [Dendrosporobacter quercicolus]